MPIEFIDKIANEFEEIEQDPTDFKITVKSFGINNFTLYVNPEELNWNFGDKTKDMAENIGGVVESSYPDDFDILQFTGTTGGFLTQNPSQEDGYAAYVREDSVSYKRFQAFLDLFKNNGDIYSEAGKILDSRYVVISFLGVVWEGKFLSFNYTEREDQPLQFDLEFEFQVHDTFMLT